MADITPPRLATLASPPSWVNLAGRVDRSACFDLRFSQVRRLADLQLVGQSKQRLANTALDPLPTHDDDDTDTDTDTDSPALLDVVGYVRRSYLEAVGQVTVTASDLEALLAARPPRTISGDFRTAKSNAMKRAHRPDGRGRPRRDRAHGGKLGAPGPDHNLEPNPNRGQSRIKILALQPPESPQPESRNAQPESRNPAPAPTNTWSQTIRVERWRHHARLAYHYLICPTCNARSKKLFLPLCTTAELRDALVAHRWLTTLAQHTPNRPGTALESHIIERYHLLFPPRQLRCRQCLGLRYGTGHRHK